MMIRKIAVTFVVIVGFFYLQKSIFAEEIFIIKINLWDNSLTILENEKVIKRYSIASGREEHPTPIGQFVVIEKSKDWGGGFGSRWLGLNVPWGMYGIHGTNKPSLIGKNVSSGCVRMNNKDVEDLFDRIPVGTPVHIVGPIHGLDHHIDVLAVGSKGTLVYLVQQRLALAGYYHGDVNGIFDEKTKQAIEKFQKDHHLIITGHGNQRLYTELGLLE